MEVKSLLGSKENLSNLLMNSTIVEITVEIVKKLWGDINGLIVCALFSVLLSFTTYLISDDLTFKGLLITFYNSVLTFLVSIGCYESVIKMISKGIR